VTTSARLLDNLSAGLNISNLAPAASLREELDETLTVMRPDRESRRVVSSTAGQLLAERHNGAQPTKRASPSIEIPSADGKEARFPVVERELCRRFVRRVSRQPQINY